MVAIGIIVLRPSQESEIVAWGKISRFHDRVWRGTLHSHLFLMPGL